MFHTNGFGFYSKDILKKFKYFPCTLFFKWPTGFPKHLLEKSNSHSFSWLWKTRYATCSPTVWLQLLCLPCYLGPPQFNYAIWTQNLMHTKKFYHFWAIIHDSFNSCELPPVDFTSRSYRMVWFAAQKPSD